MTAPSIYASASYTRPTALTVFGVLNLLLGILEVIALIGFARLALTPPEVGKPNPFWALSQHESIFYTALIAALGINLVKAYSGRELLIGRRLGRYLANISGTVELCLGILSFIASLIFLLSPLIVKARNASSQQLASIESALLIVSITTFLGGILAIGYPLLSLLYVNSHRSVTYLNRNVEGVG